MGNNFDIQLYSFVLGTCTLSSCHLSMIFRPSFSVSTTLASFEVDTLLPLMYPTPNLGG